MNRKRWETAQIKELAHKWGFSHVRVNHGKYVRDKGKIFIWIFEEYDRLMEKKEDKFIFQWFLKDIVENLELGTYENIPETGDMYKEGYIVNKGRVIIMLVK